MIYDVVIIGGGAAGMSAALYASRGGMNTLLIEKLSCGGQAVRTYEVDNYPGFYNTPTGIELSKAMETHFKKFGAEVVSENVRTIENASGDVKTIKTRKNTYHARTIIFATGATPKKLGISGEAELSGAGVSYCATCDGAFFKDKDVVVIGAGNTACEDALYLSRFCKNVYMLNRSSAFRAQKILADKVKADPKITVYTNMIAEKFEGNNTLEKVYAKNTVTGEAGFINASGAIIAIGIEPFSELAKSIGISTCEKGFIKTDMYMRTNLKGIYAAGDVRFSPLRQIVTAASDGAVAATDAINYVNGIK